MREETQTEKIKPMIYVTIKKSTKGFRLVLTNKNGNKVNDFYKSKSNAKRAWKKFEKQVKEGKAELQ